MLATESYGEATAALEKSLAARDKAAEALTKDLMTFQGRGDRARAADLAALGQLLPTSIAFWMGSLGRVAILGMALAGWFLAGQSRIVAILVDFGVVPI